MTPEGRWLLVEAARQETRWPSPSWLKGHAAEHSPDRTASQYAGWAQAIKRRPGTQVYALVHPVHGNDAIAFIDPQDRVLVWFSLEENVNLSCFYIDLPVVDYLVQQGDAYWRLPDTELT